MLGGATLDKKAFTLIELLAVIVILAIIALIATPIILGIISDAKKQANERSIEQYANALRNAVASEQTKGKIITRIEDIAPDDMKKYYDGDVTCDITEIHEDGTLYLAGCSANGELVDGYTYGEAKGYTLYANGTPVYFNVDTGTVCQASEAVSTTGTKSGCMKFYAFNDSEDSSTVNLLLDHNTKKFVAWNSNVGWANDGEQGPLTLLNQLHTDTDSWVGTETPSPNTYSYTNTTGKVYDSGVSLVSGKTGYSYNIDYSGYKARLISADEIAQITGNDGWTSSTGNYFYLDTNTSTRNNSINAKGLSNYKWLFDRTSGCESYGCANNDSGTYGYWTSSARSFDSYDAWRVGFNDNVNGISAGSDGSVGLRPVITVSKSKLS